MVLKPPARITTSGAAHDPISRHLRDHRCGRDRGAGRITLDQASMLDLAVGQLESIDETERTLGPQPAQSRAKRLYVADV